MKIVSTRCVHWNMILPVATWGSGDTKGRRPRPDEQPVVADPMLAELPLNQLESPRRFEQLVCDLAVQVHHLRKPKFYGRSEERRVGKECSS